MYKLKELRQKLGLSQKEFAEKLGIEYQNYNKYELGKNEPSIETMIKIPYDYGISLDYLCDRKTNNTIATNLLSSEQNYIIKKVMSFDEKKLNKIIGYIDSLEEKDN